MIDQNMIDETVDRLRKLGVPDSLNRWLKMTPASHEQAAAAVARNIARSNIMTKVPGEKERALRAMRNKESPVRAKPEADEAKTPVDASAETTLTRKPAAEAASQKQEITMKPNATTKAKGKTSAKGKARTPVKGATKPANGVRSGSKLETIVGLLKRKDGCTASEVLEATGWPAVSMPQQAKAAGLKLEKSKEKGQPTRYRAA